MPSKIPVYLEIGSKRTFAGAIDWPGWCRAGRDEAAALEALVAYAPRYAQVVRRADHKLAPPSDVSALEVIERLKGGSGTDFGAPGEAPSSDGQPLNQTDLERLES